MPLPLAAESLVRLAVLSSLFLVAAHLLAVALRGRSAATRHLWWTSALLAVLLIPLASLLPGRLRWLPSAPVEAGAETEVIQPPSSGAGARETMEAVGSAALAAHETGTRDRNAPDSEPASAEPRAAEVAAPPAPALAAGVATGVAELPAAPAAPFPWAPILGWLWILGSSLLLWKVVAAAVVAARIVRASDPASATQQVNFEQLAAGIRVPGATRLVVSARLDAPRTTGVLRPVVIAPADEAWHQSADGQTALRHEISHVSRMDVGTQLIGLLARALYWWNPMAWTAVRAQRRDAELSCDDAVLLQGTDPTDYAACLVSSARLARSGRHDLQLAMAHAGGLEERVEAALDGEQRRRRMSVAARNGTWAAVGLAVACAANITRAEAPQPGLSEDLVASDTKPATQPTEPASDPVIAQTLTLVVNADGSGDHATIQGAVDAAPAGCIIEIRPGVYAEKVRIEKALTLRGDDWETCQVTSDLDEDSTPTLTIAASAKVELTGLKLSATGSSSGGGLRQSSVLLIDGGSAIVAECAVLGSPASGVRVQGDATLTMIDTLVAGAWAEGIVVRQAKEGAGRVLIKDCAIRHNHHNEIMIGGAAPRTRVESCWISGAGWHGIRYDHAAPEIIGNRFFVNERSGIYASGRTSALVQGNLFLGNGISCWSANKDRIIGNTFVGEADGGMYGSNDSAVSIIGKSRPQVLNNVISTWPSAIWIGVSSSDGPQAQPMKEWTIQKNVLWNVETALKSKDPAAALRAEDGNQEVAPGFVDPASGDYSLKPDGLGVKAQAGATSVLAARSPWSLQEEEKAIAMGPDSVVAKKRRQTADAKVRAAQMTARAAAKGWVDGATQIQDAAVREASLTSIHTALRSSTPSDVEAGLSALTQVSEVRFDKKPFAETARALAASLRGDARTKAFSSITMMRAEPLDSDLQLLLDAIEGSPDHALLTQAARLLMGLSGRNLTGPTGAAVLKLMNSDDVSTKETLRSMWGAIVSDDLETKVLELAAPGARGRHDAIYFGLSTFQEKSPRVVDALIEIAPERSEDGGRALWGLTHGVGAESTDKAADFHLAYLEARSSGSSMRYCFQGLGQYASAKHLPKIQALIDNELVDDSTRTKLRGIAQRLGEQGTGD